MSKLCTAIVVLWLGMAAAVGAQDHGKAAAQAEPAKTAKPEPVKVAPAVVPPIVTDKRQSLQVTPTVPPAKVAAAVAEAIRAAEAAEARRVARGGGTSPHPPSARRAPGASRTQPARHYEVRWPTQHVIVAWPSATSDRVTLTWPDAF